MWRRCRSRAPGRRRCEQFVKVQVVKGGRRAKMWERVFSEEEREEIRTEELLSDVVSDVVEVRWETIASAGDDEDFFSLAALFSLKTLPVVAVYSREFFWDQDGCIFRELFWDRDGRCCCVHKFGRVLRFGAGDSMYSIIKQKYGNEAKRRKESVA